MGSLQKPLKRHPKHNRKFGLNKNNPKTIHKTKTLERPLKLLKRRFRLRIGKFRFRENFVFKPAIHAGDHL